MSARRRRPDTLTVVKDLLSFLGGWALIVHQALFVPPRDFNLYLLLVGAGLVGVPGVGQLLATRTGGSQSQDLSEASPPPSRSSSNGAGADR